MGNCLATTLSWFSLFKDMVVNLHSPVHTANDLEFERKNPKDLHSIFLVHTSPHGRPFKSNATRRAGWQERLAGPLEVCEM
jgi:hypothetical protein